MGLSRGQKVRGIIISSKCIMSMARYHSLQQNSKAEGHKFTGKSNTSIFDIVGSSVRYQRNFAHTAFIFVTHDRIHITSVKIQVR